MNYSELTIITPTLNEADNIRELHDSLYSLYPEISMIVADDGSKDSTVETVKDLQKRNKKLFLIDRKEESVKGLTVSILDGIKACETKYFCVMDADLQHPPEVVSKLYEMVCKKYDIVSGCRKPYQENQGFHRIIITRIATFFAKSYLKLNGLKIVDPMSGFFCSKTELCKKIIDQNYNRFEFSGYKVLFDLLRLVKEKISFKEYSYQFRFRKGGKSKLQPKHGLYFLRSLFK